MDKKKDTSSTLDKEVKVEPIVSATVEVDKEKLSSLLARLERLESAANKAGLAKYDSGLKKDLSTLIDLRTIDGKVIIKWDDMITNVCEKNAHGVFYEDQKVKVYFEDDTDLEIDYVLMDRRIKPHRAKVLKEIINNEEEEIKKSWSRYLYL